jgi:hypothetical protein
MKRYEGLRKFRRTKVTVDGHPLRARLDLRSHSPAEFEWGYGGSGPAQLALAILADHLGNDEDALNLYQRFKWVVVAEFPHCSWTLTGSEIDQALQVLRKAETLLEGAM